MPEVGNTFQKADYLEYDDDILPSEQNIGAIDAEISQQKPSRTIKNDSSSTETPNLLKSPLSRLTSKRRNLYTHIKSSRLWNCLRTLWTKRPKSSLLLYALVFLLITTAAVLLLQWSVYQEPSYAPDAVVDENTRAANSIIGQLTSFVTQIWLHHQYQFVLNYLILAVVYAIIILVINRFWIASGVFGTSIMVFAIANRCKMVARNEPVIPADLNFLKGGNTGDIISFIPVESSGTVQKAIHLLVWLVAACLLMYVLDRRKAVIPSAWRPSKFTKTTIISTVVRLVAFVACVALAVSFTWNLPTPDSWANKLARNLSDAPQLWNAQGDAVANGPIVNFLRLSHAKVMDKPVGYSKDKMEQLAKKYDNSASNINSERYNELIDNTVIMVLSESFSDPTRIPGVSLVQDPMPNIRGIESNTTSGHALSTGYGGGTANLEYQALTGLNMANFAPSMSIAYQQLTPNQKQVFTFNQLWNTTDDDSASIAIHPYLHSMYFRSTNYQKFNFGTFYSLNGKNQIDCPTLDNSGYASDQCAYDNTLDVVRNSSDAQFVQLVTMQNHIPYPADWYNDNEFAQAEVPASDRYDNAALATYAKGVQYTDTFTADLVVPDLLRKFSFARFWCGVQFASLRLSSSRDMSR